MKTGGFRIYIAGLFGALLILTIMGVSWHSGPGTDEIRWNAEKKLCWEDFKGNPDRESSKDALTESGINFSWTCDRRGFKAEVFAIFVPSKSWVRTPTQRLLRHEQTHFDITEIHARRIRKYFGDMRNPCWMGKEGINAAAKRMIQESYAMQRAYDSETKHSLREQEQVRWELMVKAELENLSAWAAP